MMNKQEQRLYKDLLLSKASHQMWWLYNIQSLGMQPIDVYTGDLHTLLTDTASEEYKAAETARYHEELMASSHGAPGLH